MIAILVGLFLAGWFLNRPASAALRTALLNALGLGITTARAGALDALYYTWAAIRRMAWIIGSFAGLLLLAHLWGNQWFWLALLGLSVTASVASMWVLHTLRYPVAEIAARFTAAGSFAAQMPLTPKLPEWADPGKAKGGWVILAVLASIVHGALSGAWVLFSLPILAFAGVLKGFGGLAVLAEKTMRWLSRSLAAVSLVLLFVVAVSLVDAKYATHILDTWTLVLLSLLAALGITMGVLAAGTVEDRQPAIPVTAIFTGVLTGAVLLGLLWAHFDPRGGREMVRAFRNAGDNLRTYARIGNDASVITNHAYWVLAGDTVLRPCPNCTVDDGKLKGAVGTPKEIGHGQRLISVSTESPFELDGVMWMRVFRPYNEARPVLGYNLGPAAAWIAPKDYLEGAAKPAEPKPTAPVRATGQGALAGVIALSPLLLVAIAPFALGMTFLVMGGVGRKVFGVRPNQAVAGSTVAAARANGGGQGAHPLWTFALWCAIGPWIAATLLGLVSILTYNGHLPFGTVGDAQRLLSTLLSATVFGLALAGIVLACTRRKGWAFVLVLGALVVFGFRSVVVEAKGFDPNAPASIFGYRPGVGGSAAMSIVPPAATVLPSVQRSDFANNLLMVDQELTAYPRLASNRPMILALISNESDWDKSAKNPRSSAAGLMQLVEATQRKYGVADPYDPRANVRGGLAFLADLDARYQGDWSKMLLAYAWGPENVLPATAFATSLAAADAASPESSTAVRRILERAGGQQP